MAEQKQPVDKPSNDIAYQDEEKSKVQRIFKFAKGLRAPHETEISDAFRYTYPSRVFYGEQHQQADRTALYDTTAVDAVNNLVNTIISLLVPQNKPWGSIELRSAYDKRIQSREVRNLLDDINNKLAEHFDKSNFYLTASEAMFDCVVSAIGCMFCYDDDTALRYVHVPVNELFFTTNAYGAIDAVFREHKLSSRQLTERFAKALPEDILCGCMEKPDDKHSVIEASIPQLNGNFKYCIYYEKGWILLDEVLSDFNPFIVFRWNLNGTSWGESPVRQALPHIRTLNEFVKLALAFGEYAALGLWQTQDETINLEELRNKLKPGTVLPLESELKPVQFPGSFTIGEQMIRDQQAQILRLLLSDPLPPIQNGNTYMTATEISARLAEFYRRVGTPALRLEKEFLRPVVTQAIGRLQLRGDIAPVETMQAVFGADRSLLDEDLFSVVVTSAARKVVRYNEAISDLNAIGQVAQVMGPEFIQVYINTDVLVPKLLNNLGLSPDLLNSQDQIQANREAAQKRAMAEQAMDRGQQAFEMSKTNAETSHTLAKAAAIRNK